MGALQSKKTYQVEKMEKGLSSEIRKKSSVTKKEDRNTTQLKEEARKSILQAQVPKKVQNSEAAAEKPQEKQNDLELSNATADLVQAEAAKEVKNGEGATSKDVQPKSVTYAVPIEEQNVCENKPKVTESKATEKPPEYQNTDKPPVQEAKVDEAIHQNSSPKTEPELPNQREIEQELHDKVAFIQKEDKLEKQQTVSAELDKDDVKPAEEQHPKDVAEDVKPPVVEDKQNLDKPEINSAKQQEDLDNKIKPETNPEPKDAETEEKPLKEKTKTPAEILKTEEILPQKETEPESPKTEEKSTELQEDIPKPKAIETLTEITNKPEIKTETNDLNQKSEDVKHNNENQESQVKIQTYSVAATDKKHSTKDEDLEKIDEVINEIHTASKKNQDQIQTVTVEEEVKNEQKQDIENSFAAPKTITKVESEEPKIEEPSTVLTKSDEITNKIQKTKDLEEITVDLENDKAEKQIKFVPLQDNSNEKPDTNFINQDEQKAQDHQSQQLKVLEQEIVVHESDQEKSDHSSETFVETKKDTDKSQEHNHVEVKKELPARNPQAVVVKPELPKNNLENKEVKENSSQEIPPALEKIQDIEEEVKRLREQILHFTGTSKDNVYLTLKEMLIRNMIKLDDLSTESNEEIRNERKKVIKFVQECLDTLERNVDKTKTNDSDSE